MGESLYRLDWTKFKMQKFEEADHQLDYWRAKTPAERLKAAYYLISCAFNFDLNNPPRLDRNKFSIRKHKH